ncbi:MAG TPA: Uma2 family endonuclease [Gemmatimonadales bacterium]
MAFTKHFTADAVRGLPDDGNRYETVHGELLVTPAPGGLHQWVLGRLHLLLGNYLADHGVDGLLFSPADISFDSDTLVQPDLFVADWSAFGRSFAWEDIRTLHLVIEILSPSTARADRVTKRRLYQEQRIDQYWIVDTDQRQVEVWTPEAGSPVVERERLTWRHPAIRTGCTVDLRELFARGAR